MNRLNPLWNNEVLDQLETVSGSTFEVVYTGEVVTKERMLREKMPAAAASSL